MATFLQLKDIIRDRLNEDYLDTQIANAINSTIQFYEREHLWFNEAIANIVLNVDNPLVPSIPSDFQYEVQNGGLTITDNQYVYTLYRQNKISFDHLDTGGQGVPQFYVVRDGQILIYPKPDKAYTLSLFYVKSYPDLVNDTDTNDWTDNAARLIEAKTIEDIWLDQRKDLERWGVFSQKTKREFDALKGMNRRRLATNELVTEDIVNSDFTVLDNFFLR